MSGMKIDVQWSPVDEDLFITSGSVITLYQVDDAHTKEQNPDKRCSSNKPRILTLDSKPQQQMKHVAWYPKSDRRNTFAVAQANGRITITGLGNANNELIGKEFNLRMGQRSSNYIAWNPLESNYLAQGFEKNRNDPCILIWDVTRESNMEITDRSRHSFSEAPIVKPHLEMGFGEGSSSICWFPNHASNFVTGINKHLRIYDLRDSSKIQREAHHRCVSGLCMDPLDNSRLASYFENQVAVWDIRNFDRPVNVITENKNVTKLSWSPTTLGILAALTKDCSHVKLHDIRRFLFGSDDIEQVSIERKIQPFKSAMSSFAWHPKQENRLMTVMPNGQLKNMVFFERLPVKWSSNPEMAMRLDKAVVNCAECSKEEHITVTMKERLSLKYGQDANNVNISMKAVEKEPHLHGLWKWIHNVRSLQPGLEAKGKRKLSTADMGIMSVLKLDKPDGLRSEAVPTNWKTSQAGKYAKRTMYRSEERDLALRICRWRPDKSTENLQGFCDSANRIERSAAMDIFYLAIDSALSTLSDSRALTSPGVFSDKTSLQAVAMALSGYTEEKDTLWQKTCGHLRTQMENPYLRAIFTFLACEEDRYEDVLKYQRSTEESSVSLGSKDTAMSVADRVEYALNYLSDAKLNVYLNSLVHELTEKGDLDGILLTGMTRQGIDLLQRYVNFTLDVQTAAIAASFSASLSVMKDPQVNEWVDGYRDLLDRWKLWHQRAVFDNVRQSLVPDSRINPQILVSCNFCGKSISSVASNTSLMSKLRSTISGFRGPQHRPKITCCPNCRKALPRCAICLTHMGTLSGAVAEANSKNKSCPFDDWFTWCQTCRHGGHAGHMTEWFGEHMECPVTGCPCNCMSLDSVSQSSKPIPLYGVKEDDACKG